MTSLGSFIVLLVVLGLVYYLVSSLLPESPFKKVALVILTCVAVVVGVVFVLNLLGISTGNLGRIGQ